MINLVHVGIVVLVAIILLSPFRRLWSRPALRQVRQTRRGALTLTGLSLLAVGLASFGIATLISEKWILFIGLGGFALALLLRGYLLRRPGVQSPKEPAAQTRKPS